MIIIKQGNIYLIHFNLLTDSQYIAKDVIGEFVYNINDLELISITVSPEIGTVSNLEPNKYLFGSLPPKKDYLIYCEFKILEEKINLPITLTVTTTSNDINIDNNSKTVNLFTYLDGILLSDICNSVSNCTKENLFFDTFQDFPTIGNNQMLYVDRSTGNIYIWNGIGYITTSVVSTDGSVSAVSTPTGYDLSVAHVSNVDGSITLNDGTVIPAPVAETTTTLVNNGDGTATYTNEAGATVTFPIGGVTAVDNGDGTYTLTLANGSTVTISDTSTSTMVDNGDGTYTYTDETGTATTFSTNDVITTLVDNGDGTLTYTSEDGTTTIFNQGFTSVTDNTDGTWTYTYPDGSATTLNICALLAASSCLPTLADNGDGTYTFDDGQGNTTTFNGGWTTFANSTGGFTATYPDGSTYVWAETITTLAAATNGWAYTSENGTTTTVTYLFDNSTPSTPNLLVQVNGTTQATIPLNSYDVNIQTSGGFTFNPTTDVITITETDGETHTIDLTPLRTTVTSTDNSVEIVQSVNVNGSTNYDLGVKAHTNQVETVPYTGTELPSIAGINTGDTTDAQFTDGTVVSYTWDGSAWIADFNIYNSAINNLQLIGSNIERGNVNPGGGQPADFIRNTYNWLGGSYQDKWQSSGDANLFDIKANQTVNAPNTTNSGNGAVNIGTLGANGRYKLNIGGAIWLDNGRNSQFIGNQAGLNNIMSEQIGIGTRANMNSIASFNDAIGFEALMTNTTGSFNTCFGNQSMRNANGFANVGLGFATLYLNQGAYNVAIGTNALLSNVSGIMNFAIGYNSMVLNNSGSRNIGIGYSSLYSTNSGWQNIGIGAEAMQQNISGNNNVAIGDLALQFNTTSSNNTTIGIQSQRYGTGYWNVGVGNFNQLYGKNCNYNTSLGGNTMYQNRYASNNVALGYESMYALNNVNAPSLIAGKQYEIVSQGTSDFTLVGSPNNNVGTIFTATGSTVGTGTTASITDIPNNNTAVGFQSLYATQGFSGNVALGYQAGYNTTGNNRLYIENSSDSVTPLIGGNFATDELIIGGVQKFSIQYPPSGAGVSNGSIFYGTDGALYFKGGSTVTQIAPN